MVSSKVARPASSSTGKPAMINSPAFPSTPLERVSAATTSSNPGTKVVGAWSLMLLHPLFSPSVLKRSVELKLLFINVDKQINVKYPGYGGSCGAGPSGREEVTVPLLGGCQGEGGSLPECWG